MNIRPITEDVYNKIIEISEKLKVINEKEGWFREDSIKKLIPLDVKLQRGFIATEKGEVLGFITYTSHNGGPIIGWIGVDPNYHRKGIGKKLIEKV